MLNKLKTILIIFFITRLFGAENIVHISDPIYPFLNRLEILNVISGFNSGALPIKRSEIAKFLQQAEVNQHELSNNDKIFLLEFMADYRLETTETRHNSLGNRHLFLPILDKDAFVGTCRNIVSRENQQEETHLFCYENENIFAWGDAAYTAYFQWKDGAYRRIISDLYQFRCQLGNNLSTTVRFSRFEKQYNPDYPDPIKEEYGNFNFFHESQNNYSFDNVHSSLVYHADYFDLGLYHQPILWGRSKKNNLIFSDNAQAFPYIGFTSGFKNVKLSFIHGSLINDSTAYANTADNIRNTSKYIAAHRIDISLFKNKLKFGFTDMSVYGNRNMELAYLMPVNFYWSTEHTLMDRDNSLISMDFEYIFNHGVSLYGALFLDELKFGEIGKKWWANKHAIQAGVKWATSAGPFPMDLLIEYSAVRPWTYTHDYFYSNFTHGGICLGFPGGPNSQLLFLGNNTRFSSRLHLDLNYSFMQHGLDDEDNIWGGDPLTMYSYRNRDYDQKTEWLMGNILKITSIQAQINYEFLNNSMIFAGLEYRKTDSLTENLFIQSGIRINI